jgi:transcriptional antiterminator RfaH
MYFPKITSSAAWYCVRTQPKHEHIAAAHLRQFVGGIDVFNPQLRIRRRTRRGAVWFIEALFPGYVFTRFDPATTLQAVKSTPGVKGVVSFGLRTPSIPDSVIDELRADFGQEHPIEVGDDIREGDRVTVATGPFQGFDATVLGVLPAPERVRILLDILGRNTRVELAREHVVVEKSTAQLLQCR